ncbi:MAG: MFS transporter [Deinococcota bacterium]
MKAFLIIWLGQTASSVGSKMTGFAVGIWIFEQTGQATALALTNIFASIPTLILVLFSGIIVDRVKRKRLMMAGDTVAGCSTLVLIMLFNAGQLEIWHLYIAYAVNAPFDTLQGLAYQSSMSLLVPKQHYARVSGLATLTWYSGNILSPVFAAAIYSVGGLLGVMLVDILTFIIAIVTVGVSRIPQPTPTPDASSYTIRQQLAYGFRYIWDRPALRTLVVVSCLWTLFHDATPDTAMVLARTGNDERVLALVGAASGIGGVIASLIVGVWGGPKRRMLAFGWGMVSAGIGKMFKGLGRGITTWAPAQAYTSANFPVMGSARQAVLMAKVDPASQGRFFASLKIATGLVSLVTQILMGPLGDYVFEPAMAEGGALAPYLGGVFGTGPGAGFSVQFTLLGLGMTGVGVLALLQKRLRTIETDLVDHDQVEQDQVESDAEVAAAS